MSWILEILKQKRECLKEIGKRKVSKDGRFGFDPLQYHYQTPIFICFTCLMHIGMHKGWSREHALSLSTEQAVINSRFFYETNYKYDLSTFSNLSNWFHYCYLDDIRFRYCLFIKWVPKILLKKKQQGIRWEVYRF